MPIEENTINILKLSGRVARAMVDTFVIRGDDATTPDDVALFQIKDLIEEIDPNVFNRILADRKRKRKKRLT